MTLYIHVVINLAQSSQNRNALVYSQSRNPVDTASTLSDVIAHN